MIAIELFGCSGGMAEGFKRAGIEFAASFDCDPDAISSYTRNIGHAPIPLDVRRLLDIVRWSTRGRVLDLVVADPPCTPWSRAGKRKGLDDDRDMLLVTVELLERWHPRCWLIGNVPGLDDSTNASLLHRVMAPLRRAYCIDQVSLDAAAYGVPQHRVRPFWFGHPVGTPCIRWPSPTHGNVARQLQIVGAELQPYVTVRDALSHLKPRELGKRIRIRETRTRSGHPCSTPDRPAGTILASQPSNCGNVLAYGRGDHRPSEIDRPARTLTTNTHSDGALLAHPKHPINEPDKPSYVITTREGGGAQGAQVMRWPWDRPSTTVCATPQLSGIGRSGRRGQPQSFNAIKLSEKAAAILQGFPDGWHFAGATKRARWSQIGQAMPPALAHAVASSIVAWFQADALPLRAAEASR
jgi:site-specific DNA-cytosine methylase